MTGNASSWNISNVNVVLENEVIRGTVFVKDGIIQEVIAGGSVDNTEQLDVLTIDGKGGWLLPGFIDVHVHGGFGGDFMNADREKYDRITKFHASNGTTGMLATTMTASKEAIEAVLSAVANYQKDTMPGASLLGVHLEGPFISEKWPGAQNPAYIRDPELNWLKAWNEQYPGLIRLLTLAPERAGAKETIAWMAEAGIIAAAGHTDAVYSEIISAADVGLTHAVHTYNAMRGLHHREPGTLGAVLTDDRIYAEVIADGEHVHPAAIALFLAAKPLEKVILITDAIEASGMPDGEYDLGGQAVTVKNGTARLSGTNTLAGSSLSMIDAFRYMLANTKLTVNEVSQLASANPARELGLYEQKGSIATGKHADLVLTDSEFNVAQTWVQGRTVFSK
ncbi:N-acetylglucosamine-6-phosphate deacetylase [Paenibacillus sp. GSMTC-2017]|uniref:N-acetylglucosamine-6-phosphate deacetylase n=1 Tax=Paenibacillus sp. GSMTC-2017 TaxID=2794350 RepID=UPI0018DA29F0|nr:N-acetylglucosamine-6-phosphate deacetylase [Paenibacillus sp. GSMTC-2017]MBH5317224.1 N-acetylglucosamine-6-phosphate deacetylase [Paenibacillus sp. GSMTC-2017]